MKNRILFLLIITQFFTSCGEKIYNINITPLVKNAPEVNQINTIELGIPLVINEVGYVFKALKINEDRKVKPGQITRELKQGDIFLNKYETKKYQLFENIKNNTFGIAISKIDNKQGLYLKKDMSVEIITLVNPIKVTETNFLIKSKDYFKQEFIYNGKVGNSIKFIYREFIDEIARPAFTQELQYDLSENSIVGIKGLRIEVINANNTNIEYKILNQFSN